MTEQKSDRPPLKTIEKSGTYILTIVRTKTQRFDKNGLGFSATRLFFVDKQGNCLNKNYTCQWPKSLATLLGRATDTYAKPLSEKASGEQLEQYVTPLFGKTVELEIEVVIKPPYQGKAQFGHTFKNIKAHKPNETTDQSDPAAFDEPKSDVPF